MKKSFASVLSLFLVLVLFVSGLPVSASASDFNNSMKGDTKATDYSSSPSVEDFRLGDNYRKITEPQSKSYLSDYKLIYIDTDKGHSLSVHSKPNGNKNSHHDYAYHGSAVIALAKENGCYCVLYFDQQNTLKCGWVDAKSTNSKYPGTTYTIGRRIDTLETNYLAFPLCSWSRDCFLDTTQYFTYCKDIQFDCVSFTLDYQVTARNGSSTEDCLGTRYIYINDGYGWDYVGSFDLKDLAPVHVVINLDKPYNLFAVATFADCPGADTMTYRQSVIDLVFGTID